MGSREQLQQAYHLLKAGEKQAAARLLQPICKAEPDNSDAWWLLANALTDPHQIQTALDHLLYINPFHEQAQRKLDKIHAELGQHLPSAPTPISRRKTSPRFLLAIMAGLVLISLIAAAFILQGNSEVSEARVTLPTSAGQVVTFTPISTSTPLPTTTPLPATWTPTSSPTFDPNFMTNTPWLQPTRTLATADPSQFGETYWEGIGDGYTLETFTRTGGRHLRFYEFPIKVYVDGGDSEWSSAVNHALVQLSQVLLIERIDTEADATLVIYILPPDEYEYWSGCDKTETLGCAVILDLGDFGGGDTYHRIYGQVYLSADSYNKAGTVLHEMLHALGVMVHSPEPGDIMYPFILEQATLSRRDLNTLRRLYANPSYAD